MEHFYWGALKAEHFIGSSDDLPLMYGAGIKGTWTVIAVLDAIAEFEEAELFKFPISSPALSGFQDILQILRVQLGRPLNSNGITPLCIFREISMVPEEAVSVVLD